MEEVLSWRKRGHRGLRGRQGIDGRWVCMVAFDDILLEQGNAEGKVETGHEYSIVSLMEPSK